MSPDEYRAEADKLERIADWHRDQSIQLRKAATRLRIQANEDEKNPPTETERVYRLLENM